MPGSIGRPATDDGDDFAKAKTAYLADIDGIVYGEDPSEGFVRGRRFLHPKLGFTFTAPDGFTLDNTAQAVLGIKHGGGQALRLDVVRVPAEQTLAEYLTSGWIENIDPATVEDVTINGFPGATAAAKGDQWDFRLYAHSLRQRRLPLHLRHQTPHARHRPRLSRIGRYVPPHESGRNRGGEAASPADRHRGAERHGGKARGQNGGRRPRRRALPRLNGLDPGDRLKPGSQVKVVVE